MADIDVRRSWSAVWWILGVIAIILVLWMLLEAIETDARVVLGHAGSVGVVVALVAQMPRIRSRGAVPGGHWMSDTGIGRATRCWGRCCRATTAALMRAPCLGENCQSESRSRLSSLSVHQARIRPFRE